MHISKHYNSNKIGSGLDITLEFNLSKGYFCDAYHWNEEYKEWVECEYWTKKRKYWKVHRNSGCENWEGLE